MPKKLILGLLLAGLVLAQLPPNLRATQGPPAGSSLVASSGDGQDIGSNPDSALPLPKQAVPSSPTPLIVLSQLPRTTGDKAQWVGTVRDFSCFEGEKWMRFERSWYSECPQSKAWVRVRAPGFVWLVVNEKVVRVAPYFPWDADLWVEISPDFLICGSNQIQIWLYERCPFVRYELWTPQQDCSSACDRDLAFYDRRACRCECLRKSCPGGFQRPELPSPSCECQTASAQTP